MKVEQVINTDYSTIYILSDGSKVLENNGYDYMSKGGAHLSYNRNTKRIQMINQAITKFKTQE